jgi:hypothetical protein
MGVGLWVVGGLRVLKKFFGYFFEIQRTNDTQDARFYRTQRTKSQIFAFFKGI